MGTGSTPATMWAAPRSRSRRWWPGWCRGGLDRWVGRLRHCGDGPAVHRGQAPSTLGTFLQSFTFGHVRQLDKVAATVLVNLARHLPLLPNADQVTWVDVDDPVKPTYGYGKQGDGYGYTRSSSPPGP